MGQNDDADVGGDSKPPRSFEDPRAVFSRRTLVAAGLASFAGCSLLGGDDDPRSSIHGGDDGTKTMTTPTQEPDQQSMNETVPPGNVQEAIDQAVADGTNQVALQPGETYDPASTWTIREGVTLDYNDAKVTLTSDIDLHDVAPGACVKRPMVDLRNVLGSYSSSVFRFDSARYGFYGDNPTWHVRGGLTRGRKGEGTLYEFAQGGRKAIYFVHVDHAVRDIGTVVEMRRSDQFGINGNRIQGLWYGFDVGIHMHNESTPEDAVDNISGNCFDVIAQPSKSRILWDLEAGHFNVLRGRQWDYSSYSDVMWRIHADGATNRIGNMFHWFPVGGNQEQLMTEIGPRVFDDQLGDPRNRVVVPWLQGFAVGEFTG